MTQKSLNPPLPILLVDDETPWLRSLTVTLKGAGYNNLLKCSDGRDAMALMTAQPIGLVLLDLVMPHASGEELLAVLSEGHPQVPVIVLSGLNQLETAVRCMRLGAFDYYVKASEKGRLLIGIQHALAFGALRQENLRLRDGMLNARLGHPEAFAGIAAASRKMKAVCRYIEAVAASNEPLLITGESGVGKELIGRAVHRLCRPEQPLIAVNIAGLDDNVFSDTLFGHVRGAFTGAEQARGGMIERAGGGTLFLDEIGDLCSAAQVKLLRLLQDGEYYPLGCDQPKRNRARIVCATNLSLEERVAAGAFRKDLYYRLCCHRVHIPPLRERPEDLPLLLRHFCAEAAQALGKTCPPLPQPLPRRLVTYPFPGNIRELRALTYDAVSLHRRGALTLAIGDSLAGADRPIEVKGTADGPAALSFASETFPTLEEAGHLLVAEALRRTAGNRTLAAAMLGISRQGLGKRLRKFPPRT